MFQSKLNIFDDEYISNIGVFYLMKENTSSYAMIADMAVYNAAILINSQLTMKQGTCFTGRIRYKTTQHIFQYHMVQKKTKPSHNRNSKKSGEGW